MSVSKRILFGDDPADEGARQRLSEETRKRLEPFKYKIPLRRRNAIRAGPRWDPSWPASVMTAMKDLNIDAVQINEQLCTKTQADADAVRSRAEKIYRARIEEKLNRGLPPMP